MVNVATLKSHPEKLLFNHVNGVIENTKKLTKGTDSSKWAELAAIFHDLGKINPNFQDKFRSKKAEGYSHHAYLSAYAFYTFCINKSNREIVKQFFNVDSIQNELIAAIVLIAKHHGHLPDFCPIASLETDPYILGRGEIKNLYIFLQEELQGLPIEEFTQNFDGFDQMIGFKHLLVNRKVQEHFLNKLIFDTKHTKNYLDFFLSTQFAFSALIQADKTDAMNSRVIDEDKVKVGAFCKIYAETITKYVSKFKPNSELNILRTKIREESVQNIQDPLEKGKRVFELTAPTGSGKTIMLLALASKIIEEKGNYRIMYALPFLSITEQVENEVLEIFKEYEGDNFIQRIDSKSENQKFNEIQEQLDVNPTEEKIKELDYLAFQESVFAFPFVITTFVRFFETLLSNHNSTLLKLPNFSKSIFLLDEIQSLPPRLYTFFVAYLQRFCEKFDSYGIISTATQPNFKLPKEEKIKCFFNAYEKPTSILDYQKYFENDVFNRYQIDRLEEEINIEGLAERVFNEEKSVLVILNTIDDSKELLKELEDRFSDDELYLLNTHFTPNDRKRKINIVKERLDSRKKVILISTQLIEAGVDIDFPVLYRDFALVSSIVQSAGRCNRNGKLEELGKVRLINLVKEGKKRANLIYGRGKDKDILTFTKNALGIEKSYQEKELLNVQKMFFSEIATKLNFAKHSQKKFNLEFDFLEDIKECAFGKIGKFQLIDEREYGEAKRYYIPQNEEDSCFEDLIMLDQKMRLIIQSSERNWSQINEIKYKIQSKLKVMSNQIVQLRIRDKDNAPSLGNEKDFMGLQKISADEYSFKRGVSLKGDCIL